MLVAVSFFVFPLSHYALLLATRKASRNKLLYRKMEFQSRRCFIFATATLLGLVFLSFTSVVREGWSFSFSATNVVRSKMNSTVDTPLQSPEGPNPTHYNHIDLSIPLRPVQELRRYIHAHSQQSLSAESVSSRVTFHQRKFAVAYYCCPQRAGNFFHSFFNTVTWAMIHNRTLLWAYQDNKNLESDCHAILKRAEWLPSHEEWKRRLQLPDPVPVSNDPSTWLENQEHVVVLYPQIPDILSADESIFRKAWNYHPMRSHRFVDYIKKLPISYQNTTKQLYAEGYAFLYGMLCTHIFQLRYQPRYDVAHPIGTSHDKLPDFRTDIAIHSRHTVEADDGSYINNEQDCIKTVLDKLLFFPETSCRVFVMSDRPTTVSKLKDWLTQYKNCSVVTATHALSAGPVQEHGPWAGVGFLEDLTIAAAAQHAIIGDIHRSSTALLRELTEYRRTVASWRNNEEREDLIICTLPNRHLSGYDYGIGSPTFRHHKFLDPLNPVKVFDEYLQGKKDPESTLVVSFNLEYNAQNEIYKLLNALAYAIVRNLDFTIVGEKCNSTCKDWSTLGIKSWVNSQSEVEDVKGTVLQWKDVTDNSHIHFTIADWEEIFGGLGDDATTARLHALYEQGVDFMYGFLFGKMFHFCEKSLLPNDPLPENSIILEIFDGEDGISSILECVQALVHQKEQGQGPEYCHISVLSSSPKIENTALTNVIDVNAQDTYTLPFRDNQNCSLSFHSMVTHLKGETNPSSSFWAILQKASRARGGWIRPLDDAKAALPDRQTSIALIRERLEYQRHLETWKKGREPFLIASLPECKY